MTVDNNYRLSDLSSLIFLSGEERRIGVKEVEVGPSDLVHPSFSVRKPGVTKFLTTNSSKSLILQSLMLLLKRTFYGSRRDDPGVRDSVATRSRLPVEGKGLVRVGKSEEVVERVNSR